MNNLCLMNKVYIQNDKTSFKNSNTKTKNIIVSIFLALYVSFDIISILWLKEYARLLVYIGFFLVFISFLIMTSKSIIKFTNIEVIVYLSIYISLIFSYFYNGNNEITQLVWYIRYICFVYIISHYKLSGLPFILLYFFISVHLASLMLFGISPATISDEFSQNAISIFLLPPIVSYFIVRGNNKNFIVDIIICLTYAILSVWSGSRSAVLTSFILIMGIILTEREKFSKHIIKRIILIGILALIVLLIFTATGKLESIFDLITKRELRPINQEPRYLIIIEYLQACQSNILNALFGPKLDSINIINFYGGNPHSMFLRLHSNFGLVVFSLLTILMLISSVKLFKYHKFYFFIFIALIMRGTTDSAGFPGILDQFILYFIFYSLKLKKTRTKNAKTIKRNAKSLNVEIAKTSK